MSFYIKSKIFLNRLFLKYQLGKSCKIRNILTGKNFEIDIDRKSVKLVYIHSANFRNYCCIRMRFNSTLKIGKDVFFNNFCSINCLDKITIGDYCIFGESVKIYDHNHIFNQINTPFKRQGFSTSSIIIGNNCWIGSNVTILKGVKIGDNVVIAAGCTIRQDIPSNSIVKNQQKIKIESIIWEERKH